MNTKTKKTGRSSNHTWIIVVGGISGSCRIKDNLVYKHIERNDKSLHFKNDSEQSLVNW